MTSARKGHGGLREARLAEVERAYFMHRLSTVERWWPLYLAKHPKADKARIVEKLATLIHARPVSLLADGPPTWEKLRKGDFMPYLEPWRSHMRSRPAEAGLPSFPGGGGGSGGGASPCAPTYGLVLGNGFQWYDVEAPSEPQTQDRKNVIPLGADGWAGAHGARFWAGFAILDSWMDDADLLDSSVADRSVHLAVVKIVPPPPTCDVTAAFRTALFAYLPHGATVKNNWGGLDDTDYASVKLDLCACVRADGSDFPPPDAFNYVSGMSYDASHSAPNWTETWIDIEVPVSAGVAPCIYLGVRITFEGADCRLSIGSVDLALDAYFGFRYPATDSGPGLLYSYTP